MRAMIVLLPREGMWRRGVFHISSLLSYLIPTRAETTAIVRGNGVFMIRRSPQSEQTVADNDVNHWINDIDAGPVFGYRILCTGLPSPAARRFLVCSLADGVGVMRRSENWFRRLPKYFVTFDGWR